MIDPRIALMGQPPQIETAQAAEEGAAQVQNLQNVGQLQQGQIAAQPGQLQAQSLANQQTQQQLDQTKALNAAYADALTPGANGGAPTLDTGKLTKALVLAGQGQAIPGVIKSVQESQEAGVKLAKDRADLATQQQDYYGSVASTVAKAGNDPRLLLTMSAAAQAAGHVDPAESGPIIQQLEASLQADPTGAQARALTADFTAHHIAMSNAQQKLINEAQSSQGTLLSGQARQTEADTGKLKATTEADQTYSKMISDAYGGVKSADDLNAANLRLVAGGLPTKYLNLLQTKFDPAAIAQIAQQNLTPVERNNLNGVTNSSELALKAAKGDPDAIAALKIQQDQSIAERKASQQATNINITPAGQQVLNDNFKTTGQLVSIPRGPGAQVAVNTINAVGASSNNFNPGVAKSNFKADSGSLANMQKQSDSLDAYGAKFIGNLNQFSSIVKSIPDSGSPYLNVPIRMLDEKLLGRDVYGRLNVARTIAANEGGRVLAGGANLGGVVSDNARHEIGQLLDPNATLGQWMTAADQLNKDYGITKTAMANQIATLKARIASAPAADAVTPVSPHVEAIRAKYKY